MADRRKHRGWPLVYELEGQAVFVLQKSEAGTICVKQAGRWGISKANRERAADFLALNSVPPMTQDEAYEFLFSNGGLS